MLKNNFIRKIYSVVWLKTLSFLFPVNIQIILKKALFNEDNSSKLSEKTRELLCKYYLSDIESLEKLLSVNLSKWKKIGLVTITYTQLM